MADQYARNLTEAVNKLNSLSVFELNTDVVYNQIVQLEKDWWAFRQAFGNMCDNEAAFAKVGFVSDANRPGIVDVLLKFCQAEAAAQRAASVSDQPILRAFQPLMRVLVSAVDDSAPLCAETEKQQVILYLQLCLVRPEYVEGRLADTIDEGPPRAALEIFRFMANVMYRSPDIADTIKAHNGDVILRKYGDCCNHTLALRALIAQSYLVTDPKGNELPLSDSLLRFTWELLNRKMQRVSGGVGDFTLYGLLVYLHQLIRCSDACGQGLLRYGLLDALCKIMTAPPGSGNDQSTPGEKRSCAKICWALALLEASGKDNAAHMRKHSKLLAALESIKPVRNDVAQAADGAIWQIRNRGTRGNNSRFRSAPPPPSAVTRSAPSAPVDTQHSSGDTPAAAENPTAAAAPVSTAEDASDSAPAKAPSSDPDPDPDPEPANGSAHGGMIESSAANVKRMVMVSYTSHYKPDLVKRLNDALQRIGIVTWIYNNEMKGDMYDEMADAIEKSAAVLICYSNAYFNSDPCHAELNYAREWKKLLIPVRLENFTPRGWLGISISGKLYFDFSAADGDSDLFNVQIRKVAEAIRAEYDRLGLR